MKQRNREKDANREAAIVRTRAPEGAAAGREAEARLMRGTVAWFDAEKRIGVIRTEDGDNLFTRGDGLEAGQRVTFTIGIGASGNPTALNVQLIRDVSH